MSTATVTTAVTPSPGVTNFLNAFTQYAAIAAATIQAEEAAIAAKDHASEVTIGLEGVATALGTVNPIWGADAQAALAVAAPLVTLIVNLFHKKTTAVTA